MLLQMKKSLFLFHAKIHQQIRTFKKFSTGLDNFRVFFVCFLWIEDSFFSRQQGLEI